MQSLQSDAIRSSCASVPRSGLQSYDAYGDIRAQRKKSTCTHSEESVHSGREGGACIEHSGRQHDSHDHQCHEHQEQHYLTSLETTPSWVFSRCRTSVATYLVIRSAGFLLPSIFVCHFEQTHLHQILNSLNIQEPQFHMFCFSFLPLICQL